MGAGPAYIAWGVFRQKPAAFGGMPPNLNDCYEISRLLLLDDHVIVPIRHLRRCPHRSYELSDRCRTFRRDECAPLVRLQNARPPVQARQHLRDSARHSPARPHRL